MNSSLKQASLRSLFQGKRCWEWEQHHFCLLLHFWNWIVLLHRVLKRHKAFIFKQQLLKIYDTFIWFECRFSISPLTTGFKIGQMPHVTLVIRVFEVAFVFHFSLLILFRQEKGRQTIEKTDPGIPVRCICGLLLYKCLLLHAGANPAAYFKYIG